MYVECQELLQLFGLPYIVAPFEAEAQCAFLQKEGLVDGVATDDNDVFLFGARKVYRNMFSQGKHLEEYCNRDIERELGLDQSKLIQLALLLGSDYTEGVSGIGIVNAMEVVHAFSHHERQLAGFRDWMEAPDTQILDLAGKLSCSQDQEKEQQNTQPYDTLAMFKDQHKNVKKNWKLPEGFPDEAVEKAYKEATIDANKTKFTFGRPQDDLIKNWCKEKFGWDEERSCEQLDEALKAYAEQQVQLTMDQFLQFRERFAKIRSTRLQSAVAGITGRRNPEIALAGIPKEAKKRKVKQSGECAKQLRRKKPRKDNQKDDIQIEPQQTANVLIQNVDSQTQSFENIGEEQDTNNTNTINDEVDIQSLEKEQTFGEFEDNRKDAEEIDYRKEQNIVTNSQYEQDNISLQEKGQILGNTIQQKQNTKGIDQQKNITKQQRNKRQKQCSNNEDGLSMSKGQKKARKNQQLDNNSIVVEEQRQQVKQSKETEQQQLTSQRELRRRQKTVNYKEVDSTD
eukprot:TRINITY_DN2474_c1_g1_i12.p1 TRINITY_DN2474_c1_g1~~TRINITY_DN2474_c1_g1_i12.p1  ORF type:complete len:512 (-),score=97.12 TRINITY_DN2474_c1_g1_i12:423-1958(-)